MMTKTKLSIGDRVVKSYDVYDFSPEVDGGGAGTVVAVNSNKLFDTYTVEWDATSKRVKYVADELVKR